MSFIVIEGLDGSGKSTQVNMLRHYLQQQGIAYAYLHFPIVESPYFGELIARFLRGDLGSIESVDPYVVALLYAGDRYNAKAFIENSLQHGKIILADRYVYSNIGFQCAKLTSDEAAGRLYQWILDLEYKYFDIPRPDLSIFLDVPIDFVKQKLSENRNSDERNYLQGKADIHEADISFQEKVRSSYLKAVETDKAFIRIDCVDKNGAMLPAESIFAEIIDTLLQQNILLKNNSQ